MNSKFYENYYGELQSAFQSGTLSIRFNKDRTHNAVIMKFIFDNSKHVWMYCGQMSVFRQDFYKKISEDENLNLDINGDELKSIVSCGVSDFLKREGTTLNIILEKNIEGDFSDLILRDVFEEALSNAKIKLSKMPDNIVNIEGVNHFTYTDSGIIRLEEDKKNHSALCIFHDNVAHEKLSDSFAKLETFATPVKCG